MGLFQVRFSAVRVRFSTIFHERCRLNAEFDRVQVQACQGTGIRRAGWPKPSYTIMKKKLEKSLLGPSTSVDRRLRCSRCKFRRIVGNLHFLLFTRRFARPPEKLLPDRIRHERIENFRKLQDFLAVARVEFGVLNGTQHLKHRERKMRQHDSLNREHTARKVGNS